MRSLFNTLLLIFTAITSFGQEQVKSEIILTARKSGEIPLPVLSRGFFVMPAGSQEFQGNIELFPIVPKPDIEDSLEQQRKPLNLIIKGKFPVDNLDFKSVADNGKSFTIQVTAALNDSAHTIPFNITIVILRDAPITPDGTTAVYTPKFNFNCLLQPKYYGLDKPPFNINYPVFIQGTEAVINKTE